MLELRNISVRFGNLSAVNDVTLDVAEHEIVCVLGPSGSGKTTLLRVIAGLAEPTGGAGAVVRLDGQDLAGAPAHRRGVGLMFQDHALFPHLDVAGNVGFGLRMHGVARSEVSRRVDELLGLVGLAGVGSRRIDTLSGGEQQRVALARALAPRPRLLMLDEPLGQLDRALRERLVVELRGLFRQLGTTVLAVTHDQSEAFALADRLVVMNAGRIVQIGAPEHVWREPASAFVARFLGFGNVCSVSTDRDVVAGTSEVPTVVDTPWGEVALPHPTSLSSDTFDLLIRPRGVVLDSYGPIRATIVGRVFRGDHWLLQLALPDGAQLEAAIDFSRSLGAADDLEVGVETRWRIDPREVVVLQRT